MMECLGARHDHRQVRDDVQVLDDLPNLPGGGRDIEGRVIDPRTFQRRYWPSLGLEPFPEPAP
jgi:hypothetical protein